MIKGTFKRNDSGRIVSFELTGHAQAGEYGKDIVCAAASALAISAVNGIDALAGVTPIVEANNEEGGYLLVKLVPRLTQEQSNISPDSFRESIDWSAICSRKNTAIISKSKQSKKTRRCISC